MLQQAFVWLRSSIRYVRLRQATASSGLDFYGQGTCSRMVQHEDVFTLFVLFQTFSATSFHLSFRSCVDVDHSDPNYISCLALLRILQIF